MDAIFVLMIHSMIGYTCFWKAFIPRIVQCNNDVTRFLLAQSIQLDFLHFYKRFTWIEHPSLWLRKLSDDSVIIMPVLLLDILVPKLVDSLRAALEELMILDPALSGVLDWEHLWILTLLMSLGLNYEVLAYMLWFQRSQRLVLVRILNFRWLLCHHNFVILVRDILLFDLFQFVIFSNAL